jgi:hypothetical protein
MVPHLTVCTYRQQRRHNERKKRKLSTAANNTSVPIYKYRSKNIEL